MYIVSEALRLFANVQESGVYREQTAIITNYKKPLDLATKFIPVWVKVAVALALGLGTMIGWKRIVVTVGEKIGKTHLTYAQGASAEMVAMCHLRRDLVRITGQYHSRVLFRCCRNHGCEQDRVAVVHHPEHLLWRGSSLCPWRPLCRLAYSGSLCNLPIRARYQPPYKPQQSRTKSGASIPPIEAPFLLPAPNA